LAQSPNNQVAHSSVTKIRKPRCIAGPNKATNFLIRSTTRSTKKSLTPADVSQEDAQWYQRLPETVRRKQFTLQEQLLLAGRCDSVILDAADEALYRLGGRQANRSLPSLRSSSSTPSSVFSLDTADLEKPSSGMDNSMMDSFRWLDQDDNLDLSLDDYHSHVIESAMSATKPSSRAHSIGRNLSLTNIPFARSSTDKIPSVSGRRSSNFSIHTLQSHQYPLTALPVKQPSQLSYPIFDPPAAHYQDPEARLKLRVYLASPQKFDEALEFGFLSLQSSTRPSSRRPSISTHQPTLAATDLQTFYDDDNASLYRDLEDGETASLPDVDSPDTPLDASFRPTHHIPGSKPGSSDNARLQLWHMASEPYAHGSAGNREMTLRMTLTRPDLRADKSVIYPKGTDPLALDDLPPVADGGDIWDRLQKDDSMVKKLWRRVSRKL